MKHTISKNLKRILHSLNMSLSDFIEKSGLSPGTVNNIYYEKTDNPKLETLISICDALDISVDYLIGRKKYAEDELEIIKNYRQMSSHGKQFVLAMSKFEKNYTDFEEEQEYNHEVDCYLPEVKQEDTEIKYFIPCLEPTGLFKDGVLYDTSIKTRISTHLENVFIAFKIPNDSLANTYFKGDIIFVEKRRPNIGEIAIYQKGNHIFIRKYDKNEATGKHILQSLNINNKDIILSNSEMEDYKTIGTCIYIRRKK